MKPSQKLRELMAQPEIIVAPGVESGLAIRLVEQAGFQAAYASGGAIARSCGYPDLGLLSFTEITERLAQLIDVSDLPLIADADTGYGNEVNVYRTVRYWQRLGIAAFHLEDQQFPKRCGHLKDKSLIPSQDMIRKIKTAKDSALDPDFVLIARTDAIAVEGFEAALERAALYLEAGADMIFVEAPQTIAHIETIASTISQPKLINMFQGGKTPRVALPRLQELGYKLVIIPSDLQRSAIFAMQQTLEAIRQNGDSDRLADQMASFNEREKIVKTEGYLAKGMG
jgi:2-methylisocitrate lyase-like PEP mutase family enzyme